jgi:hypothetical protein
MGLSCLSPKTGCLWGYYLFLCLAGGQLGLRIQWFSSGKQAPRQRLGRLPEQFGRIAPEDEEPGRQRPAIRPEPQQRKELRPALNLIDDNESFERTQRRLGLRQTGQAPRVFQIKVIERIDGDELSGQGCLATLRGPTSATTRLRPRAVRTRRVSVGRSIIALIVYHETLSCNARDSSNVSEAQPLRPAPAAESGRCRSGCALQLP